MTGRREVVKSMLAGSMALALDASSLRASSRSASELLIRGGRVVNVDGIRDADVRVSGETIAEIGRGLKAGADSRMIDVTGKLVMPGGIDPHTHLSPPFADDLTSGSEAALAGGITTVGTFAFAGEGETIAAALERNAATMGPLAIADFFLHGFAWPPTAAVAASMADVVRAGQPSIKFFMPIEDFAAKLPEVIQVLEAAAREGVVAMIHCEDAALLGAAARRLAAEGRTSLASYGESRPVIAELAATNQAIALCEMTGATCYLVHLSSGRALETCRAAKARGLKLYVETRPLYLHLTEEKMRGPDFPLYVGQPPLRTKQDSEALWAGLADGSIDVLATDHAPWTRAQKLDPSLTITNLRPGVSDLQAMLPMFFSEGVGKRKLPLERFVAVTSTNAARIFGLYPRKGVIREGADADVVIWDPERAGTIRAENDRSKSDYSVYEGWQVRGWPTLTIRRGDVVVESGHSLGQPGSGRITARSFR
jgi:dihydropyrimidinase